MIIAAGFSVMVIPLGDAVETRTTDVNDIMFPPKKANLASVYICQVFQTRLGTEPGNVCYDIAHHVDSKTSRNLKIKS